MQRSMRLPFGRAASLAGERSRKRWTASKVREALSAYGFLAPYLIILGIFTVIATAYAFYLSFFYVDFGFTQPIFYGFTNYQHIWYDLTHNGTFLTGILNVARYTLVTVVLQTSLALALALLINQNVRGRSFFRTAFYLPALTSSVAISLIFIWLFNKEGAFNYILSLIDIHGTDWLGNPSTALWAIASLNIWTTAPTFMLVYLAALQDIPDTLIEAARMDGATGREILFHIILPLLRPTTFVVVALGTIGGFQLFDQVFVMEGASGGPLNSTLTPVLQIVNTAFKDSLMGMACAEAVVLFIVIFTFTILQKRLIDTNIEY